MSDKSVLAAYRNRLGKVPDQKVADQAGVSRTLVVNYRKKLGISAYQGHKGEAAAAKAVLENASDRPFRGRRSALDPFVGQLGVLPDAEVAKLAGVTAENVRTYRQRRNIASIWQAGDPPVAAPPSVPQAATKPFTRPTPRNANITSLSPARHEASVPAPSAPRPPHQEPSGGAASPVAAVPVATDEATSGTAFLVLVDTEQGPRSYALIAADIGAAATTAAARVAMRHPAGTIRSIQRVAELLPL